MVVGAHKLLMLGSKSLGITLREFKAPLDLRSRFLDRPREKSSLNAVLDKGEPQTFFLHRLVDPLFDLNEFFFALGIEWPLAKLRVMRNSDPQFIDREESKATFENSVKNPVPIEDSDIQVVFPCGFVFNLGPRFVRHKLARDEECFLITAVGVNKLFDVRSNLRAPVLLGTERKRPTFRTSTKAYMPRKRESVSDWVRLGIDFAVTSASRTCLG
jgi:hypothetical protein